MKKFLVLALVLALTSSAFALGLPEVSYTWDEQMTVDPDTSATGDWVEGRGGSNLPDVSGGVMTFDSTTHPFALADDRNDNALFGTIDIEIGFGAAPQNANGGVGLWFNADRNATNSTGNAFGFAFNVLLGRDDYGDQVIRFEQQGVDVLVPEGAVVFDGQFVDGGLDQPGLLSYTIAHSGGTTVGSLVVPRAMPHDPMATAGLTILSWYMGVDNGTIDYLTVVNTVPEPITFALLSLGGLFLRRRK